MVQIIAKIASRTTTGQDFLNDMLVVIYDFVERIGLEILSSHEVQILAKRETAQVIALYDAANLWVFLLQSHDTRSREDDFELWETVVTQPQFTAPVGLFEHLVDE